MTKPARHPVHTVATDRRLVESVAARIIERFADRLPDLSRVVLLIPETGAATAVRRALLNQARAQGHPALLGPRILRLREWAAQFGPDDRQVVDQQTRELILVGALREHASLFGHGNLWSLADSLLELFDELTLNQVGLPADWPEFHQRLAGAYGDGAAGLLALEQESRLVHTLWHAWHQQLSSRQLADHSSAFLMQLAASLEQDGDDLLLVAPHRLTGAEANWAAQMIAAGRLELWVHGPSADADEATASPSAAVLARAGLAPERPAPVDDPVCTLVQQAFATAPPLTERAEHCARRFPESPLSGRLGVFGANGTEQEARAVELQVRLWLLAGRRSVGIITENRRLARRVRALLERAGVPLEDSAGWALSTTSAAAMLERWLECVEEDFPWLPLLDLLKSPFAFSDQPREEHLERTFRLERDVMVHENVGRGLHRYREHLAFRRQRMPANMAAGFDAVALLLDQLDHAAEPLRRLIDGEHPAGEYFEALEQALAGIGAIDLLEADSAGAHLLRTMHSLGGAADAEGLLLSWREFRGWLGRTLERTTFRPPVPHGPVVLSDLAGARLARFDAVILAGADREHLPGKPAASPFFNEVVRRELGLATDGERLAERFNRFRSLIETAPELLITYRREQDGEPMLPSPWLELLLAFHRAGWGGDLPADELAHKLELHGNEVVSRSQRPAPGTRPAPVLPAALIPNRFSASAYQQLVDCPYRFYAARGLGLAAPDTIREALEKAEYGALVHRCLEAFHGGIKGLPGPWHGAVTPERRDEAVGLLGQVTDAVFSEGLEDNFVHRGWRRRWREIIPAYIEWQTGREADGWRVEQVELQTEALIGPVALGGRIDRIDRGEPGLAIIDYKTGAAASLEDVRAGESVQLPFYFLLTNNDAKPVARVELVTLDHNKVRSRTSIDGEELRALAEQNGTRLQQIVSALQAGGELPAWGDQQACAWCDFQGVCRRTVWSDTVGPA